MDLSGVIELFVETLTTPIQIGAGLIFLYGIISLIMAIKEDNPQAKSSAIKSMIAGGVLFGISTQLGSIVQTSNNMIEIASNPFPLL